MASEAYRDVDDFLKDYFDWVHFSKLDSDRRNEFKKLEAAGKLPKGMEKWNIDVEKPEIGTSLSEENNVMHPLFEDMRALILDLREQNAAGQIKDKNLVDLIEGKGKDTVFNSVFVPLKLPDFVTDLRARRKLVKEMTEGYEKFLEKKKEVEEQYLEKEGEVAARILKKWEVEEQSFENIIDKLRSGQINNNNEFQSLKKVFDKIPLSVSGSEATAALEQIDGYIKGRKDTSSSATKRDYINFKGNYQELLERLSVMPQEAWGDMGIFGQRLGRAKKQDFSKIPVPKVDRRNAFEKGVGWIKNLKNDRIKGLDRHRTHIYRIPAAFEIMEGIMVGQKFDTKGGLPKFIDALETAKKDGAGDDKTTDFMVEELKKMQEGHPKAFEDAHKNGKDMNFMVQRLIKDFVENGADEEKGKALLECLAMLRARLFSTAGRKDFFKPEWGPMKAVLGPLASSWPIQFVANEADRLFSMSVKTVSAGWVVLSNSIKNRPGRALLNTGVDRGELAGMKSDLVSRGDSEKLAQIKMYTEFWNSLIDDRGIFAIELNQGQGIDMVVQGNNGQINTGLGLSEKIFKSKNLWPLSSRAKAQDRYLKAAEKTKEKIEELKEFVESQKDKSDGTVDWRVFDAAYKKQRDMGKK